MNKKISLFLSFFFLFFSEKKIAHQHEIWPKKILINKPHQDPHNLWLSMITIPDKQCRQDQAAPRGVYTACHSIFWTCYSVVEPHCSKCRIITAIFQVSEYLGILP